jgi:hypothetical protein
MMRYITVYGGLQSCAAIPDFAISSVDPALSWAYTAV